MNTSPARATAHHVAAQVGGRVVRTGPGRFAVVVPHPATYAENMRLAPS